MQTLKIEGKQPKHYIIEQSGLRVKSFKNKMLPSETLVAFENIKRDKFHHTEKSTLFILIGGIFLFICVLSFVSASPIETQSYYVVTAVWGTLSVASFIFYFLYQQNVFFVKTFTGKYIRFDVVKNEEEIDRFVKELIQKRDEYLNVTYGTPNMHISYDAQFSNFNIMHREQIISTEELQEKIKTLNNLFNQTAPKNNFTGYSQN